MGKRLSSAEKMRRAAVRYARKSMGLKQRVRRTRRHLRAS